MRAYIHTGRQQNIEHSNQIFLGFFFFFFLVCKMHTRRRKKRQNILGLLLFLLLLLVVTPLVVVAQRCGDVAGTESASGTESRLGDGSSPGVVDYHPVDSRQGEDETAGVAQAVVAGIVVAGVGVAGVVVAGVVVVGVVGVVVLSRHFGYCRASKG